MSDIETHPWHVGHPETEKEQAGERGARESRDKIPKKTWIEWSVLWRRRARPRKSSDRSSRSKKAERRARPRRAKEGKKVLENQD